MKVLSIALLFLTLTGCDTSALYDGTMHGAPVRWPDDVKTCGVIQQVMIPLKILMTYDQYPFIPYGENGAGCGYTREDKTIVMYDGDEFGQVKMGVDNTGEGHFYRVYYDSALLNNKLIKSHPDSDYDPVWKRKVPSTKYDPSYWIYNRPIGSVKDISINGLKWHHYMYYRFNSYAANPDASAIPVTSLPWLPYAQDPNPVIATPHPEALTQVGEVYEHAVDATHTMIIWARYDRTVTQDAHWLKVRRAMLRKLVDAVTITPLTPQKIEKLKAEAAAQRKAEFRSENQVKH